MKQMKSFKETIIGTILMTNRNYKLGYAFELRVKKHLESLGYLVIRSSGSHGPIDLVAIPVNRIDLERLCNPDGGHPILLIQCKRTGKLSKKDRIALEILDRTAMHCELRHYYMPGKTGIAFETVESNGAPLIHQ
jgi:hypothetical protein